jgi:hypothetical protein
MVKDLRPVYTAPHPTEQAAEERFKEFVDTWHGQYPQSSRCVARRGRPGQEPVWSPCHPEHCAHARWPGSRSS